MSEVETQVIEVTPPRRKPKSWEALGDLVSGLETWQSSNGWWGENSLWVSAGSMNLQFVSPVFSLEENSLYVFRFSGKSERLNPLALVLLDANNDVVTLDSAIKMTAYEGEGDFTIGFSFSPEKTSEYKLALCNYYGNFDCASEILDPELEVKISSSTVNSLQWHDVDTNLPHWGPFKKWIHKKCKNSKLFNSFVAGLEMRLGKEEVLSLPMYMALCPTGQCNALCEFCSVTINRTGIIKRELSFEKIQRFLEPTLKTIYMYGLEGNGEPTMYGEFDPLLTSLTRHNADAYLITNGALLKQDQISHLLNLQSITFSLNASTADTHVAVMKLRNKFDTVTKNIKSLVAQRGISQNPLIFVSFVVNHHNIHELQHFLNFAENELQIDVIMVRPLSELGADAGTLEDLRDIVPYESLVQDALESAHEYLHDLPRRTIPNSNGRICDIRIDPASFRNVRPDPMDSIIEVPGYEGRYLAPRRKYWKVLQEKIQVCWHLNKVSLNFPENGFTGEIWQSNAVPVMPNTKLVFKANVTLVTGAFMLTFINDKGELLETIDVDSSKEINISISTDQSQSVYMVLHSVGVAFDINIDFERVITPGPGIQHEFKLPMPRRWQVDTPGVIAKWAGNELLLDSGKGNLNGKYLFKSYSVPCRKNTKITLPIDIVVEQGILVIGILTEDFQSWTHKFEFKPGEAPRKTIGIETGNNSKMQLVMFAKGEEQLKVKVNWQNTLELPPDREDWSKNDAFFIESPSDSDDTGTSVQSDKKEAARGLSFKKWLGRSKQTQKRPVKYYCSKPWTDLNNFTVDGRMDVCCITTGASQEHYALGNILKQDFQEVWNGNMMKEFRATVNTDDKLPPCARCPMAYSYQGPFINKSQTEISLIEAFRELDPAKPQWYKKCMTALGIGLSKVINSCYFRGFKN